MEDEGFFLELDDGDCLVHLGYQTHGLLIQCIAGQQLRNEFLTGVVAVGLHGEGSQWYEVDAIALFECRQIGIAQAKSQDVADAGIVAGTGSHP